MLTGAFREGFRTPASGAEARSGTAEAGVRNPAKEETAIRKGRWRRVHGLWGFEDGERSAGCSRRRLLERMRDLAAKWRVGREGKDQFWVSFVVAQGIAWRSRTKPVDGDEWSAERNSDFEVR